MTTLLSGSMTPHPGVKPRKRQFTLERAGPDTFSERILFAQELNWGPPIAKPCSNSVLPSRATELNQNICPGTHWPQTFPVFISALKFLFINSIFFSLVLLAATPWHVPGSRIISLS